MDSPARDARPRRTTGVLQLPLIRELRARGLLLPAGVGLAVIATLAQGAWSREPHVEARPPANGEPAEIEAPSRPPRAAREILETLRPGLEKTPLAYHADYWRQLGGVTRPKLIRVGGHPAVVVLRGLALTSIRAAEPVLAERRRRFAQPRDAGGTIADPAAALPESGAAESAPELIGLDVDAGAALFRVEETRAPIAFGAGKPGLVHPGALIAAVTLRADGALRVSPGHLVSTEAAGEPGPNGDLDAALPPGLGASAAAIVDLDGGLVGVALESEGRLRLWSYDRIARIVARLVSSDPVCQSLEVVALGGPVQQQLGVDGGLLVQSVRADAYAPSPSIRPGDVLLEWNRETFANPEAFARLYAGTPPGSPVRFRALRGRRLMSGTTIMPAPDCRPVGEADESLPGLGLYLEWGRPDPLAGTRSRGAWRITAVTADSPAARARLGRDDWILAVDRRELPERSLRPFDGFERRGENALLTVRRGERVRLVLATQPKS